MLFNFQNTYLIFKILILLFMVGDIMRGLPNKEVSNSRWSLRRLGAQGGVKFHLQCYFSRAVLLISYVTMSSTLDKLCRYLMLININKHWYLANELITWKPLISRMIKTIRCSLQGCREKYYDVNANNLIHIIFVCCCLNRL